ncbi:MAG: helix-hairpin-helix domain-containing protein [Cytophagales bacterium]|nr:helix-hairpin-helix domain-containing protein [Cytophagales bacterium]MDW8384560.1 helix-hairpin-helix domain-containing protein [Flammeovirgaceae bacterium]
MFRKHYYQLLAFLRAYFGYTDREAKGYLMLILLLFGLMVVPSFIRVPDNYSEEQFQKDQKTLDSLLILYQSNSNAKATTKDSSFLPYSDVSLSPFNPNRIDSIGWIKLGVPSWIVSRIIKYKSKGGYFKRKEDLQKIYGFPLQLYRKLEPYLVFDTLNTKIPAKEKTILSLPKPDLNKASETDIEKIRGIGKTTAQRIIKFREKMGGFASWEIVKKTYGLKLEQFESLQKYFTLSPLSFKKIPINSISTEDLAQFPLISKKQAQVITYYRQQRGKFIDFEDFVKTCEIPDSLANLLKPYLEF